MSKAADIHGLLAYYTCAKSWVEQSGFAEELQWQHRLDPIAWNESDFLREYAWVILNSGFREAVVRKHFDFISLCYCDWQSAEAIVECEQICVATAQTVFRNKQKLSAITETAERIVQVGFKQFRKSLTDDFYGQARTLRFIGPITVFHLAKNLGMEAAKPDRHLIRVANRFGFPHVGKMCETISKITGDRIGVADIVLWRFLERKEPVTQSV